MRLLLNEMKSLHSTLTSTPISALQKSKISILLSQPLEKARCIPEIEELRSLNVQSRKRTHRAVGISHLAEVFATQDRGVLRVRKAPHLSMQSLDLLAAFARSKFQFREAEAGDQACGDYRSFNEAQTPLSRLRIHFYQLYKLKGISINIIASYQLSGKILSFKAIKLYTAYYS
jgi:hypothetical protein